MMFAFGLASKNSITLPQHGFDSPSSSLALIAVGILGAVFLARHLVANKWL
jgi:hypothetical protein